MKPWIKWSIVTVVALVIAYLLIVVGRATSVSEESKTAETQAEAKKAEMAATVKAASDKATEEARKAEIAEAVRKAVEAAKIAPPAPRSSSTSTTTSTKERDKDREKDVLHDVTLSAHAYDAYAPTMGMRLKPVELALAEQEKLLKITEEEGKRQYAHTVADCQEQLLRAGLDIRRIEKKDERVATKADRDEAKTEAEAQAAMQSAELATAKAKQAEMDEEIAKLKAQIKDGKRRITPTLNYRPSANNVIGIQMALAPLEARLKKLEAERKEIEVKKLYWDGCQWVEVTE